MAAEHPFDTFCKSFGVTYTPKIEFTMVAKDPKQRDGAYIVVKAVRPKGKPAQLVATCHYLSEKLPTDAPGKRATDTVTFTARRVKKGWEIEASRPESSTVRKDSWYGLNFKMHMLCNCCAGYMPWMRALASQQKGAFEVAPPPERKAA